MVTLTADEDESKADRGSRADESSSESESEESKKARGISASPQDAELEAAIAAIRATKDLPRPPYPNLPNLNGPGSMQAKVNSVQTYIEKLQYNFTGVNYFDIRKNRPMTCATHTGLAPQTSRPRTGQVLLLTRVGPAADRRILETAREITRQALPIKCVEAVFLATYLTQVSIAIVSRASRPISRLPRDLPHAGEYSHSK